MTKKAVAVVGLFAVVAIIGAFLYFSSKTESQTENLYQSEDYMHEKLFNDFIIKHRKNYFNEEEYNFRLNVFKQRIYEINIHNQSNSQYTKAINRFADLTDAEFKRLYLGYKKSNIQLEQFNFQEHQLFREHVEIESSLDWKKKGAVAAVKDQGSCGSCWAFSTVAGIEGANQIKTGKMTTFSEQQLVDCAGGHYGNEGCNGGDLPGAFNYERDHGTSTERDYPYKGKDSRCKVSQTLTGPQKLVKKAKSVKRYSDSALKQALSVQPLAVCIDASTLQFYSGGVIPVNDCGKRPQLDHCVLLYGYDGSKSWSLKNSWGSSWGQKGYFRFAQGGDTCGIQQEAMVVTLN